MSVSSLSSIFKKLKIKYKFIAIKKQVPKLKALEIEDEKKRLKLRVEYLISTGFKIVYCDEVIFSPATKQRRAWSRNRENIEYLDKRSHMTTQAVIGGISTDDGLVGIHIVKRAVKQEDFVEFVDLI